MKEIKSILQLYNNFKESGEKCAIAQVVRVEESSYRREGARMLVFESGVFEGGISGGCLEGDALQRSQIAILKQEPSIVTYDTSKENEIGVGLGCNGVIDVLISPISENSATLEMLQKCVSDRGFHVITTVTALNTQIETIPLGRSFYYNKHSASLEDCQPNGLRNFLQDRIKDVLENQKSKTYHFENQGVKASVFIELIPPQFHLAIYGDNYDVYPMLEMAKLMDWDVSLVGNVQKLKKEKLQSVKYIYLKDFDARPKIDSRTAIILMAHDYKTDYENLRQLVNSPAPYIASLGPRKRFDKMIAEFKLNGFEFSKDELQRIYAPCGLEIGANTPEEIAMSLFSEILSVLSGNTGGMLRNKVGPIHERN
ncbi:XdhC family protein [Maribacter arcticus]|uniref:Xanthine and CO dehydrogenases maturation factor, XdhC/CoxF family n=1 Tax=Maribacter arcticus TaxID=561365 RepID=A0A1T5BLF6_9FLAO|nr:XdhC family protein [Maribacter arcticus]SKB48121.1 Xanthine and CO dehydrogenases maturation factor, XdhC/CoxF family [Maribacter arcticus]